jgi:hypothetical protein
VSTSAEGCETDAEKPSRLFVEEYRLDGGITTHDQWVEIEPGGYEVCWADIFGKNGGAWEWHDGQGGGGTWPSSSLGGYDTGCGGSHSFGPCAENVSWPASDWPNLVTGTQAWDGTDCDWPIYDPVAVAPPIWFEYCNVDDVADWSGVDWDNWWGAWVYSKAHENYSRHAQVKVKLFTGGRARSGKKKLWLFSASATALVRNDPGWYISYGLGPEVPPERIEIGGLGHLDIDGILAVVLPDGDPDVTPRVNGVKYWVASLGSGGYRPTNITECLTPNDPSRADVGVRERVTLKFDPELALGPNDPGTWTANFGTLANPLQQEAYPTGGSALWTAPSFARSGVEVNFKYRQAKVPFPFTVLAPDGVQVGAPECVPPPSPDRPGAWMKVRLTLTPTKVSFNHVQVMEVNTNVTGVMGYFTNYPPNPDPGANQWYQVGCDNKIMDDNAFRYGLDPIGASGSFTWPMHAIWKADNSPTNDLPGWSNQSFELGADGTMTVRKFNHSVTRSPGEPCGRVQ